MLQKLNERTQGIFAWVVISLIAATFALFGVDYYMQSRHDTLAKADVNDEAITVQDFDLFYRRNQRTNDLSEMSPAADLQRKQVLLDNLILKKLSIQSAIANGFVVTPQQVTIAIQTIPQFQEEGHFSINRYQQAIRNALFTPPDFKKEVKQDILLNQQRFAFKGTEFVLPSEVEQFVKLYMQTRDYDYLVIPYKKYVKNISITPQAIDEYYKNHHQDFKSPEKVSVDYILLSMQEVRDRIQITDQMIKTYYEENKDNDPSKQKSFESVKQDLKNQMLLEQSQAEYSRALEQLSDLSYQTPDTLTPVAEALKLKIQHSELFSREDGKTELAKNQKVIQAAFGREVLELGNNSEPLQLASDAVVVIRLNQHAAATEQPLDQVKSKIESKLIEQQAMLDAKKVGEKLMALRSHEPKFKAYFNDEHLVWIKALSVKRNDKNFPEPVNKLAFSLSHRGDMASKILDSGDFAIVSLDKVNEGNFSALDKNQRADITQQIQEFMSTMDYELYVNALLKQAKIIRY